VVFFFFQAEDGIRDRNVTGVQTCALPISAPGLGFPGEAAGKLRPYRSWRPIEQATMSYGHGISVSLVQLARAYSVFARDGEVVQIGRASCRERVEISGVAVS